MRTLAKVVALTALSLLGLSVLGAAPAAAAPSTAAHSTTVYYEFVAPEDVQFIPACTPGPQNPTCDPRGPGSVLRTSGTLSATQGGPAVGRVETTCVTTRRVGADYYGFCVVVLFTPTGKVVAAGEINETALERFEPQTLRVVGGGTLQIAQITYPNEFRLTLTR